MNPIESFDLGLRKLGLDEGPKKLKGRHAHRGVYASLVAKAGVGVESVPARHGPGYHGVKPGRFHDHRGGAARDSRLLASKNACQAHCGSAVGNYLVLSMQSALYTV